MKPALSIVGARRPIHPAATLFPAIDKIALTALVEDIRANGLVHPIIVHPNGSILDGRSRDEACHKLGIEPRSIPWQGKEGEEVAYVVSTNLHRRHLSESQRAMIAARIATLTKGAVNKATNYKSGDSTPTVAAAAAMLNVSTGLVSSAKQVLREAPEKAAEIDAGTKTVGHVRSELRRRAPSGKPIGWRTDRSPDDLGAEIAQRREAGERIAAIARGLHLSQPSAVAMADICLLMSRADLPKADKETVRAAHAAMLAGAPVEKLAAMIESVRQRLWGNARRGPGSRRMASGRLSIERRLGDRFLLSLASVESTCESAGGLKIPHLLADHAERAHKMLTAAMGNLRKLRAQIREQSDVRNEE